MFGLLSEALLPSIIGLMMHSNEEILPGDEEVISEYKEGISLPALTAHPVAIAMIGLVGSGKSTVATTLAKELSAVVVTNDKIRQLPSKRGGDYARVIFIAEELALDFLRDGYSVIMDSDYVDQDKRASLRAKLNSISIPLYFVRTTAHPDAQIFRILNEDYTEEVNLFFANASSPAEIHKASPLYGPTIKLREMLRRLPHHYRWSREGGGTWHLRRLPFKIHLDLNLTFAGWEGQLKDFCFKVNTKSL